MEQGEAKTEQLRTYTYLDAFEWALKIIVAMATGFVLANAIVTYYMLG